MTMTEAEKEQLKLTANWLNIMAAGTVVTGTVAPLIAYAAGSIPAGNINPLVLGMASAASLVVGIVLHLYARHTLRRIKP